ncbi:MAG: ABC transporter substrate-binding protein [Leucobacter sp.]
MKNRKLLATVAALGILSLGLTACVDNTSDAPTTEKTDTGGVDEAAAKLVPDDIADSGQLIIGTDLSNPPSTYKDPDGNPAGWEIELAELLATRLGLEADLRNAKFDTILPSVMGGQYQIGFSGYFDTKEREEKVDMVDYYNSGVRWAAAKGNGANIDPDNACGLKVAAQMNTFQSEVDLPEKSQACVDAGKEPINIMKFETQQDFSTAVTLGRADAMTADSPVVEWLVKESDDKLELAGDMYSPFVLGIVVAKENTELRDAVVAGMQATIDDGSYQKVLEKWGIESGAIDKIGVNGAPD